MTAFFAVQADCLTKSYRVAEREAGLRSALRSLVKPTFREVPAVQQISFQIQPGEIVGLLGPNGAGKTTTLKLLAGLLHPTAGSAEVAGYIPWQRKPEFLRRISMVLGNKSQMLWDIPPLDTFRVLGEIYSLPRQEYQQSLDELVEMLEMDSLLKRPVRNLSLGERMKCELVAGLLHHPQVLFLDEPTLGLDVSMQGKLRRFIADYNRRTDATVILTSHYMADVSALCQRVILIQEGRILYDGVLEYLARKLAPYKLLRLTLENGKAADPDSAELLHLLPPGAELLERENQHLTLRVGREAAPQLTALLLDRLEVVDLAVEDPPIEAVIDRIYQEGDV